MHQSSLPVQTNIHTQLRVTSDTRLQGRLLILARALWVALIVPALGIFAIALWLNYKQFMGPTEAIQRKVAHLDTSVNGYVAFTSHFILYVTGFSLAAKIHTNGTFACVILPMRQHHLAGYTIVR